ncbi:MAG: acyltransferase [Pseudomonadota bacterium]
MIRGIAALRALAVWMVVIHHLRTPLGTIWPPLAETPVFAAGVDLFFVISGVVMVVSTAGGHTGAGQFWARRATRIMPLYWLVTGAVIAALVMGLRPLGIAGWSGQDALTSFFLLPDIRSDGYPAPLLAVGWTLVFEAFFYLIFGLALIARAWVEPGPVVALSMLMLISLGALILPEGHAGEVVTSPLLLEFAAGVCLGLFARNLKGMSPLTALVLVLSALAVLVVGTADMIARLGPVDLITTGRDGAFLRVGTFGIPACLIVAAALVMEGACWRLPPTVAGQAAASYAIYLIHMPLLQVGEKLLGHGPLLILMMPVIAIAGVIVHRWLERPLTHAARALVSPQQRPKSSSSRMISSSSR